MNKRNQKKKKEQYIRKCRSSVITKEFIDSFVQPDSANGYKGKDEGWNYYDDGFADDNIYYYANELDHYITHLVFGIVKTQTDMGKNIRFDKEEGMKKMDDFLKGKGICE